MTTGKAKVIGSFEPLEDDDLIRANELKRRDDRYSIAEAILRLQAETGKHFALDKAVFAGAIKSYAPGDDKDPIVCEPHQRDMREEVYWDDVIKWIAIEFPHFKYPVTLIPAASVVTAGAPGGVEPATPAPVEKAKESKEQREDRRLNACEAYGLVMPKKSEGRLPDGIAKVAKLEGIERQPFSKDVKAAIERRNSLKREG